MCENNADKIKVFENKRNAIIPENRIIITKQKIDVHIIHSIKQ